MIQMSKLNEEKIREGWKNHQYKILLIFLKKF